VAAGEMKVKRCGVERVVKDWLDAVLEVLAVIDDELSICSERR
jgi:hypothetical protein